MKQLHIKLIQDSSHIQGLYFAVGEESSLHLAEDKPKLLRKSAICLLVMPPIHDDLAGAIEIINDDTHILSTTSISVENSPGVETDSTKFGTKYFRCPAGYYWNLQYCAPCPNGLHSAEGADRCFECPKGTWGPDNDPAAPCTKCKAGTYTNKLGATSCSKCPAGTSSGTGASKCTDCPRGETSKAGQLCTDCPEGTYAKLAGSPKCTPCNAPAGSQKGAYRCNKCAAGSAAGGDKAVCGLCPKNFYSDSRFAEDCKRCPPLQTSGVGATGCTPYL